MRQWGRRLYNHRGSRVASNRATIHKVVDRINNVNAMLCSAQGNRKLLISRSCKHLVKSLEGLTYKEGTKIPDKASGLDLDGRMDFRGRRGAGIHMTTRARNVARALAGDNLPQNRGGAK